MKISKVINNPTLYYKLDPGEPGLALPAKASESVARVAMHEGGNIRRFKKEAMEEGGYVVYTNLHLHLEKRGSFLAATSGRSEALIVIPDKKKKEKEDDVFLKIDNNKLDLNIEKKEKDKLDKNSNNWTNSNNKNQINQDNKNNTDITTEAIKNEIEELKIEKNNISKKIKTEDSYTEELELQKINKKIFYLEQKLKLEESKSFFDNLLKNQSFNFKLIAFNYKNNFLNQSGNLVDITV